MATHHGALSTLRDFGLEVLKYRKLLIALLAAVSLLFATSMPAWSSSVHPLLTPSQVASVVSAESAANNLANQTLSLADQAKDEQGTALAIDDEDFVKDQRAGYMTSGGAKYIPFADVPFSTALKKSTDYPASFATLADTPTAGATQAAIKKAAKYPELFIFNRSNASSAWRVSFEPSVSASIGKFAIGKNGYTMSPRTSGLAFVPSQIPGGVAAALQTYAVNGSLKSQIVSSVNGSFGEGLTASDFTRTTNQAWSVPNLFRLATLNHGYNIVTTVKPYLASDLHTYAMNTGDALVTFSLLLTVKVSAPASEMFTTKNVSGFPNLYTNVVPGRYTSVTTPIVCELVALDPPAHALSRAATVGYAPALVGADCGDIAGARAIR